MKAFGDKIIVAQNDDTDEMSAGGVVISQMKSDVRKGVVLSVGPEIDEVRDGDTICYVGNGAIEAFIEGVRVTIIRTTGLICVMTEKLAEVSA